MKYETKIKKGEKLSEIYTEMIEDNWELDYYDKEEVISLWKRKIKTKTTRKPKQNTIFYEENKEHYKRWSDALKAKYTEFRQARFETHKDYVSPLAEKKLLNIINKHSSEKVAIAILEFSIGYKSIVEDEKTIEKVRLEIKEENRKREEQIKLQEETRHSQEIREAKERRNKLIEQSGKTYEYWEEKAKEVLREKGIKEEFMGPMLPTTINKLLNNYENIHIPKLRTGRTPRGGITKLL